MFLLSFVWKCKYKKEGTAVKEPEAKTQTLVCLTLSDACARAHVTEEDKDILLLVFCALFITRIPAHPACQAGFQQVLTENSQTHLSWYSVLGKNYHCWAADRTNGALLLRSLPQRLLGVTIWISTTFTHLLRKDHFKGCTNQVSWSLWDHLTMTAAVQKSAESWIQEVCVRHFEIKMKCQE